MAIQGNSDKNPFNGTITSGSSYKYKNQIQLDIEKPSLQQDADGNYLIGSADDWKAFAELVNTTPTANVKMTADIDLGDDQTMIGTSATPYQGTFDGNAHSLNVNYVATATNTAPFHCIKGATIRGIHVTGDITTTYNYTAGLVGEVSGSGGLVEQNWSSVNVTCTNSAPFQSGLVGYINVSGERFIVTDNIVDGNQTGTSSQNWGGCIGLRNSGPTSLINNLITAHFSVGGYGNVTQQCWNKNNFTISNNYALERLYYADDNQIQVTAEQLADGSIATALQNGRDEEIWVQDSENGTPMLKIFLKDDTPTNIVELNENDKPKSGIRYNVMGQRVDENYRGIVIEDGKKYIVK